MRFRSGKKFHALPFKFCTLNSVLKSSKPRNGFFLVPPSLQTAQGFFLFPSPTASISLQGFFGFSPGSQAHVKHCWSLRWESQLIPALMYVFHTAFPSLIVTFPSLCDSHTKSPPAAGVPGFFLLLEHGVPLPSTSAILRSLAALFPIHDTLIFTLLSDVFAFHPALLFFISPFPSFLPVLPHPGPLGKQHLLCHCKPVLTQLFSAFSKWFSHPPCKVFETWFVC